MTFGTKLQQSFWLLIQEKRIVSSRALCFPAVHGTKTLMPGTYFAAVFFLLTPKPGGVVAQKAVFYCTVSMVLIGVNPSLGPVHT